MKSIVKKISVMVMLVMALTAFSIPVFAAESATSVSGEEARRKKPPRSLSPP